MRTFVVVLTEEQMESLKYEIASDLSRDGSGAMVETMTDAEFLEMAITVDVTSVRDLYPNALDNPKWTAEDIINHAG